MDVHRLRISISKECFSGVCPQGGPTCFWIGVDDISVFQAKLRISKPKNRLCTYKRNIKNVIMEEDKQNTDKKIWNGERWCRKREAFEDVETFQNSIRCKKPLEVQSEGSFNP